MIGLGIKISVGGGASRSRSLAVDFSRIFSASTLSSWVGEQIVTNGTNITSWNSTSAGPTLTPTTANVLTRTALASNNGRLATLCSQTATIAALRCDLAAPQSIWAVALATTLPFGDFRTAAATEDAISGREFLTGLSGQSRLYNDTARKHYVNGVETSNVAAGVVQIYESTVNTASALVNLNIAGSQVNGAARNWQGSIAFIGALSAAPTAQQRTDAVLLLKQYYGI